MNDLKQYFQENFTEEPPPEPKFRVGQEVYFCDDSGLGAFGWIERIEDGQFGPMYLIHKIERRSDALYLRQWQFVKEVIPSVRIGG